MITGDIVQMSEDLKKRMLQDSKEHIEEFGDCIGIVEDLVFPNGEGPERNVRWYPSGLRYGYDPADLVKVEVLESRKLLKPQFRLPYQTIEFVYKALELAEKQAEELYKENLKLKQK